MHKLLSGVAAVLMCLVFGMTDFADSAPIGRGVGVMHGGVGAFHPGVGAFHPGVGGFHPGIGGFHPGIGGFHPGIGGYHAFRGVGAFHGFYRGLYPYTLFGYPNYYSYGGYYPYYSNYEDYGPDCHFVWVKRTVKHKTVERGIWRCF